ncbi:MAG: polysaccharide biosynthesis tyrosine autokinase [Pseudomonas sp.]|uniref:polysaccharide biosynthesis tyrosine autokinase n=1 Tax=Pseudomonas abieticivorans TaxID=2931382 RepID=UPI0020BFB89D|nr:polysaccharide biosynthesis tyrosine autokinase [Pseudomonas sp. PIA16]MDE1166973.1 polysaccharide biosynthesis tyrosine autokinase [Pseudomonas sp.]
MTAMTRSSLEYYQDSQVDLATVLRTLFDHKAMIASIVGVFSVVGLAYALLAAPVYQANVMIQIEPRKVGLDATPETGKQPTSVSLATAEIELIKSRAVLGQVVTDLKLDIVTKPNYFPAIGAYVARHFKPDAGQPLNEAPLGLDSYAWGGENLEVFSLSVPDELLGLKLKLVAGEDGHYKVFDPDGGWLLDGQVGQLSDNKGVQIQLATLDARPGTEFQLTKNRVLTTSLNYQTLLKLAEAGKDSGIVYMSLEDQDPLRANLILNDISRLYLRQNIDRSSAEAAQRLEFLRSQLPIVRKQLEASEDALNNYQRRSKSVDISLETKALLDQTVNIDSMINDLRLKRTDMDRLYTRAHPASQALSTQIGQLEAQKNAMQGKIKALPETQQELLRLTRDMQVTNQTYTQLLNKSQEQDIIRAGNIGNVRIIDKADANIEEPVKPMRKLIVLISLLLGALVAVAVVFIRQAFDRGIVNPEIIENLGMPVYASVPLSKQQERLSKGRGSRTGSADSKLLSIAEPTELAVESLRSLRTSLHFAMLESRNNVLMISSPTAGVGKSFVSSNLAVIIAQTGKKVLLIDADMRKGYLHKVIGLQPRHGLSDALAARLSNKEVINATVIDNLHFISCGFAAPNPSELLMHDNFNKLLRELSPQYDLVIIDTPPIMAVTDAALVGRQAGTTLLVARFGKSSVKEVEGAKRRLAQNGVLVKGAIFNGVIRKASTADYDCAAYDYTPSKK